MESLSESSIAVQGLRAQLAVKDSIIRNLAEELSKEQARAVTAVEDIKKRSSSSSRGQDTASGSEQETTAGGVTSTAASSGDESVFARGGEAASTVASKATVTSAFSSQLYYHQGDQPPDDMPPGSCLTTAGEQLAQYEQQASAHEQHMEEVQGELQGLRAIVEKQLLEIRRLETAQQQEREEYEAQLAQQNAAAEAQLQKALLAKNPHAVRGISGSSSSSSSSASSASENTNKQRGDVLFVGGRLVASPSEAEVSGTPLEPPDAGSISERGEDHSKDAARSRREEQEDKSKSDAEKWEDEAWHWKRKCQDLREKWNKELQQMREQDHAALTQAVQEKCAEFHSALEQERAGLQVQLEQTELMLRQDADHRERALRRDSDHRLRDRENALRDEFAQKSAALQAELERELTKMQADCDARIGSSNAAVGFEAQLQQRVAELQQREGEVGQREAELQQREVNVAQGEQGIQDCQSAVLEREEEMKQCGSALEEQANHLASREQDIAERDAALAERAAEVDRSLAERSTALQAQFEQLKEQAEQVNEQAEEVQRWREELEQAREKDQQWQVEYESEYLARQKLQERCDELESECVRKEDILRSHVEKATAAEEIVREKERELLDAASQLRVAQAESEAQKSRISSLESRVLSLSERHDAEYADHTSRAERLQVALLETQARADAAAAEAEGSNRLVDQLRTEEENYYRRLQAADSRIAELEEALQAQQPGGSAVSAGQRPASISSKDTTSTREQKLGAETQEANVGNLDSRVSIARKLSRHLVGEGTPPEPSCHFVRALSVEELYPAARSPNDPPGGPLDYSRGVSPADAPPGVSQVLLCRTEIAEAAKRSQSNPRKASPVESCPPDRMGGISSSKRSSPPPVGSVGSRRQQSPLSSSKAEKSAARVRSSSQQTNYRIVPVYGQTMYQPVQNDAVDEQLAEVLNRRDHCKILFSRIAPRRYLYGRLEVELSLPQSRFAQGPRASALELIVAVLGEGGAQRDVYSIGEFIRRYEDVEFDACEQQQDSEASSSPEKGDQHLVNNAGAEPSNAAVSRTGPIGGMNIPASSSIARPNFPVPPGSLLLRNSSSRPGLLGGSTSGLPQPGRIASGISLKQASLPASSGGGAGGLATQSSTGQASKSRLPKNHLLYSLQSPSECVASPSEQEPTIRRTTLPAGGSRPSCGVGSHAGSKASSIGSIQSGGSSSSVNTMWQQSKTIFATGTSNGAASVGQLSHPLGADPENKNSNNFDAFPTIRDGVLPSSTGDIFARERSRTTSFLPTASRSALSSPVFHLSPDPPRNNEPAIPANMKLRLPPRLQTPMLTGVAQLRNLSRPPPPVLAGAASPDPTRMLSSPTSGAGGSISPSMGLISAPRRIESPFQSNPARRAPSATRVAL